MKFMSLRDKKKKHILPQHKHYQTENQEIRRVHISVSEKASIVRAWNAWLQLWNKNRCGVYCIPKSLKGKANKQDCWLAKWTRTFKRQAQEWLSEFAFKRSTMWTYSGCLTVLQDSWERKILTRLRQIWKVRWCSHPIKGWSDSDHRCLRINLGICEENTAITTAKWAAGDYLSKLPGTWMKKYMN